MPVVSSGNGGYYFTNSISRGASGSGGGNVQGQSGKCRPSVFDFKSERVGSICPTCKGVGRIPKGDLTKVYCSLPGQTLCTSRGKGLG